MSNLSYCGIDCDVCTYREAQNCKTCREYKGDIWHGTCTVAKCVLEKGLEDCGQCDVFPCKMLVDFSFDAIHGDGGKRIRNICQARMRSQLGTEKIMQVGVLVNNIEQTAKDWAELLGVPVPQIIVTDGIDKSQGVYRGAPCLATAKLAFLHCGQVDIELIEPDANSSVWREYLDRDGEGFHHIALIIKDMKAKEAMLEKMGLECIQKGEYTGGRYSYMDAPDNKYKLLLELLEND